jgi:sporulation protein YlmC with PRC-barrel domain
MRGVAVFALALLLGGCGATSPGVKVAATPSPISPSPSLPATPSGVPVSIDWTTTRVVTIDGVTGGTMAPDGSRVYSRSAVTARDGSQLGAVTPAGKIWWRWADDSRHLCAVYPPGLDLNGGATPVATALFTTLPGSAPAEIATAGSNYAQSGSTVLACSYSRRTATVGETCVMFTCETWTIDLLTHQVVGHARFDSQTPTTAVVSPDGTLMAVSDAVGANLYETYGGKLVGTLKDVRVDSFSGDSKLVLVEGGGSSSARLLEWRTGNRVAVLPPGQAVAYLAEPGGSRLAVAIGVSGATADGTVPPADILVVGGDGSVVTIARGVVPFF